MRAAIKMSGVDWPVFAAWIVSLMATGGALFIGEVLGQAPCDLCWFQRTFMFPLAVLLGLGALLGDRGVWRYGLALVAFGAGVAAYHSLLYGGIVPEPIRPCTATGPSCTGAGMTVLGLPIPYLSLIAFLLIGVLLLLSRKDVSP